MRFGNHIDQIARQARGVLTQPPADTVAERSDARGDGNVGLFAWVNGRIVEVGFGGRRAGERSDPRQPWDRESVSEGDEISVHRDEAPAPGM